MSGTGSDGDLVSLYLSECGQLVQRFERAMTDSDGDGAITDPAELFRLLHTLKGSSAMMDYAPLVEAAHAFENVLAAVKSAEEPPKNAEARAISGTGLDFAAYFRAQLARIGAGNAPERDAELCAAINALVPSAERPARDDAPVISEKPGAPGEIRLVVKLRECPMPHMRAFVAARSASKLCSSLATYPENIEKHAELADAILRGGFEIGFTPREGTTAEDVMKKLASQPFVGSCAVKSSANVSVPAPEEERSLSVEQSAVNALIGYMDALAASESELENVVASLGISSRRLVGTLSELRRAIAGAGAVAAGLGERSVERVFLQMRRAVRGMAKDLSKEIRVKTRGSDVRVDGSVLGLLSDTLIHLVRNAADHGIETPDARAARGKSAEGLITLTAAKSGDYLTVSVSDDGAGVDREAVLGRASRAGALDKPPEDYSDGEVCGLLLTAGLSTNAEVTRYSGRGVGLGTVVKRVRQAGGTVSAESRNGFGTTFTLKLPVTLTSIDGIEITLSGGRALIVPANAVTHVLHGAPAGDKLGYGGETYSALEFPGFGTGSGGYALLLGGDCGRAFIRAESVGMMTPYYVKRMPPFVADAMGADYIYSGCVQKGGAELVCVLDAVRLSERR